MKEIAIHTTLAKEGTIICDDSIDKLKEELKDFFSSDEEYSFNIICDDFINPETNKPYEYKDHATGILCLCNDIKDEDSFTYSLIAKSNKFKDRDIDKVDMCLYAIRRYIDHDFNLASSLRDAEDTKLFASFYSSSFRGGVYFKYSLPLSLIDKCVIKKDKAAFICDIDLSKLDNEEIIKFILPPYYKEIGWPDREFIRTNLDKMNYLSKNWFKNSKFGYLD